MWYIIVEFPEGIMVVHSRCWKCYFGQQEVEWTCATYLYGTGLDFLGPFYVKGNHSKIVWICLFTCVAVRAVHLEVVDDMMTEQLSWHSKRFKSRRGAPKEILDNKPQFKLTKMTIDKTWQRAVRYEDAHSCTTNQNIK